MRLYTFPLILLSLFGCINETGARAYAVVSERVHGNEFLTLRSDGGSGSPLGGLYVSGLATGESIFSAFHMHEAVRLVRRAKNTREERALAIGMGVGVLPTALERHGVIVDVAELEAEVVALAREYFNFSLNNGGELVVGDGCELVREMCAEGRRNSYDYIVHDVWNEALWSDPAAATPYMYETFENIRCVLREDGVFAMNYYGFPDAPDFVSLVGTLIAVFGSLIKIFHDEHGESYEMHREWYRDEAHTPHPPFNLVVFARPEQGQEIDFREPSDEDLLGSESIRADALIHLRDREIALVEVLKSAGDAPSPPLTISDNGCAKFHALQAHTRKAHDKEKKTMMKTGDEL